jgi:putative oxidoreductase
MTTHTTYPSMRRIRDDARYAWSDVSTHLVPFGRVLFASIFLLAVPGHFLAPTIQHAAAEGVPLASLLVPVSGIMALLGGLSVALGYKTRIGAMLLVAFLVPVTLMMHDFWSVAEPAGREIQRIMFMKNVALIGGALLLSYLGGGPYSVDAMRKPRHS